MFHFAKDMRLPQGSIPPRGDLREMLRRHVVGRGLTQMERAAARRQEALASGDLSAYRRAVRDSVRRLYGRMPAGPEAARPNVTTVSTFAHAGFRVENVLFDSFPGWQVNATVYVPTDLPPPFPAVVVPVGHSGKQFESYQLPCQYFARSGFVAVCFDPPGQAGEKQVGNDHFNDGVRDYLLGETSGRYFVADALRCIDYLATRSDVRLCRGVAMTGVSGGGTTTTFAALLDDRISVIGPSCCLTPLADLDITQCYCGCPETHHYRRYAEGTDEVDLLCAGVPTPCLLMAGANDEVFHIEDTRRLARTVGECYAAAGADGRFSLFVDDCDHAYTLAQAREFTGFMNRWLCEGPERALPELPNGSFVMLPVHELQCSPRTDVNLRTLAVAEAEALTAAWDRSHEAIRRAAADVAGVISSGAVPEAEMGEPFQVWYHDWHSVMLRPEPGIELPATLLTARREGPVPTVLHLDDAGRHRLLQRRGLLSAAIGFLSSEGAMNLLTVDLRGWGDSAPAVYPYEMAQWGGVDRYLAYATAALGDPVLAMRIRDALGALAWLRTRAEVSPARLVLTGCGLGGLVALHVAAIAGELAGVVVWDVLSSFRSLVAAAEYSWPAETFLPTVLRRYDLPLLAAAVRCPVHVHGLRDGTGDLAGTSEAEAWRKAANVTTVAEANASAVAEDVRTIARVRRRSPGAG